MKGEKKTWRVQKYPTRSTHSLSRVRKNRYIGQVKEGLVCGWKSSGNHSKEKRCILQPTRDVPGVLLKICKQVLLQGKKG